VRKADGPNNFATMEEPPGVVKPPRLGHDDERADVGWFLTYVYRYLLNRGPMRRLTLASWLLLAP
jgi:hypothetical protein